MSEFPQSHRALLDQKTGILTTIGKNGIPQTTAVWFLLDEDGDIGCWRSDARQKMKNLMERPECSFFILDAENEARYLVVRGRAELIPDTECAFGDRLGVKYERDVRFMLAEGEQRYEVKIRPVSISVR